MKKYKIGEVVKFNYDGLSGKGKIVATTKEYAGGAYVLQLQGRLKNRGHNEYLAGLNLSSNNYWYVPFDDSSLKAIHSSKKRKNGKKKREKSVLDIMYIFTAFLLLALIIESATLLLVIQHYQNSNSADTKPSIIMYDPEPTYTTIPDLEQAIKTEPEPTHTALQNSEPMVENEPEPTYVVLRDSNYEDSPELICLGTFKWTAYCSCEACCGESTGITASGEKAIEGITIAADTKLLPFGTEIISDGHVYKVQDTGGAIKGNRIDLYFNNHQDALNFGVQYKKVYIKA